MSYSQSYDLYQQTSVQTAGSGNLIVMLYDEAVRRLGAAMRLFNANKKIDTANIEKYSANIVKAQAIISELEASLNMEEGGEIAQNLLNLYIFFNHELVDANINHDLEKIATVRTMMSDLAGSWRQIATTASTPKGEYVGVNIEG